MTLCKVDTDCPGASVCYGNTSWFEARADPATNHPDGCYCSYFYGFDGPACGEWTSPVATWWIATSAVMLVLMFALSFASAYYLWVYVGQLRNRFSCNNMTQIVLVQVAVACMFLALGQVLQIAGMMAPQSFIVTGVGDKATYTWTASLALSSLGFMFTVLGSISIALYWVGLSQLTLKLERISRLNSPIWRFRVFIILFELFAGLCTIIPLSLGETSVIYFLLIPIVFIILFLYAVGVYKMSAMLAFASNVKNSANAGASPTVSPAGAHSASVRLSERSLGGVTPTNSPPHGTSSSRTLGNAFDRLALEVRMSARRIALAYVFSLGVLAGNIYTADIVGWREGASSADYVAGTHVFSQLCYFTLLLVNLAVGWGVVGNVRRHVRASRSTHDSSAQPSSNNNNNHAKRSNNQANAHSQSANEKIVAIDTSQV